MPGRVRGTVSVDIVQVIQPPTPVQLRGPGVVRWAAGTENGPRSLTWRVAGVSNKSGKDDIYVGTRQTMNAVKISLHDGDPLTGQPPATLVAFTKEFREEHQLPNRLLARLPQASEVAPGVAGVTPG
jgi:hypothetical protein